MTRKCKVRKISAAVSGAIHLSDPYLPIRKGHSMIMKPETPISTFSVILNKQVPSAVHSHSNWILAAKDVKDCQQLNTVQTFLQ